MGSHRKETHTENYVEERIFKCNECEQKFTVKEEMNEHVISFHAEKVFNCQKCNKPYTSMSFLRRHDWRCHREIECNMCGELLESREKIKQHRENKHQIFQRTYCKFYPSCIDGNKCLFEHAQESSEIFILPKWTNV